jgi:cobalt/nickel transport system ATP-binding protein
MSDSRADGSPAAPEVFAVADVRFAFDEGVEVLSGVTFTVRAGECVAILGANGSGKSTLLALLDGLAFATSGEIAVLGQPLTEDGLRDPAFNAAFRSRVGFVFQDPDAELFSATVREEIAFAPLQLGLSDVEVIARVDALIADLGLAKLADRAPFSLSGGEKKRVAIAAVLAADPSVLLLDEPTNGLDPRTQVWLLELIARLREDGRTVVLATHDLGFAEEAADRAVVLSEQHQVVADAPIREVLGDNDLLLKVNLIHEHAHRHGGLSHRHAHALGARHSHE